MGDGTGLAILDSSDGWTRVVVGDARRRDVFAATVLVTTRFWERGADLDSADVVPDADARVREVALDASAVSRLAADIDAWVSLPLAELANTPFVGEYMVAPEIGHTLVFRFGVGQRPGQAAVEVEVAQERLTSHVSFFADITGCAPFATGLKALLNARDSTLG